MCMNSEEKKTEKKKIPEDYRNFKESGEIKVNVLCSQILTRGVISSTDFLFFLLD